MRYFDADEIVKEVTVGKITYYLVRDENGAGDVSFRLMKTNNDIGEFYRDEFRDENKAIYTFNKIVRGESTFLV
jgi:hypothetical protein